ncbi:hypothetical protein EBU95_17115, partial [bacterium]|nr:hypothetical protein [bacterium]
TDTFGFYGDRIRTPFQSDNTVLSDGYQRTADRRMVLNNSRKSLLGNTVSCLEGGALKEFRFNADNNMNGRYDYLCVTGGNLTTPITLTTTTTGSITSNNEHTGLDDLNVDCGSNKVLTSFDLDTDGASYWYTYKCASSNDAEGNTYPLTCEKRYTTWNNTDDDGFRTGGRPNDVQFLDRHKVECDSDEAISQFRLQKRAGGMMRYSYTCCRH